MQLALIHVECYAGYKADETPRRFHWEGEWPEIAEVTDRWYEAGGNPERPAADCFKVLARDGNYTHIPLNELTGGVKRVGVDELYDREQYRPKVRHALGKPMFLY